MDTSASGYHPQAAGHPTQTTDAQPPATPEPALSHPPPASAAAAAATGIENLPSDDDEPLTPAQIGANHDSTEEVIKNSMGHDGREDDAPVPPVQIAAEHEEMESTIKKSVAQTQSEDAPLPPSQIATLIDEERGDDEIDGKKKAAPTTGAEADDGSPPRPAAASPPGEQDEGIPTRPPSADPSASPTTPTHHDQIPSTVGSSQQLIPIRPPPQSMLQSQDGDTVAPSGSVSAPPREPSVPVLPATLVEDLQEAIPVPNLPVGDDVQIAEQTWLKKNKKYILGGTCLIIGAAVAAGVFSAISNNGTSQTVSLHPTLWPSRSLAPSTSLQPTTSSRPSRPPSPHPSLRPAPSPPVYCGEITILTDAHPEEISWTLRNAVTINGISYPTEVVLEGSPEEEGRHKACAGLGPATCGCNEVRQADYRGDIAVTASGRTCQAWEAQAPHEHTRTPENYPDTGLGGHNYCRNPDGNDGAWCYTTDPGRRWEFCAVPSCVASSKVVLKGSPEREGDRTSDEACLKRGDYEFAIFDSYGDGIDSPGYYSVAFDGVVIAQGGDFGSEDKVSFSLPLPSSQPSESRRPSESPSSSLQPSESSSPSKTQSPSLQPSPFPSSPPSTYWSTLNWNRQGLGFNGDASFDAFGWAVAFSADASTMAIGAPGLVFFNEDRPGYVKVYHREGEGSSWEQRGDTLRGEANADGFGRSLALSEDGTTLSVGAPFHDSVGPDSGQVKVYEWNEAALDYVQIGDTLYGTASGDEFGWSLDISNDKVLAVGAVLSDANGIDSGQVTIYAWDDASSNFKQRGEAIDGDAAGYYFGYSVSLSGNGQKLAVGALDNDSNGSSSGQVRVFEWDEATANYEQLGDSLLGDAAGDEFGWSVSFSRDGTTLAIGAPLNNENGPNSGQVKVFAWDEAGSNFVQIGQSLYGKAADDDFGSSVALSSEGKTLAIGAPQIFAGKPGYVEVYGWDGAASEYKRIGQSLGGEVSVDWFGYAVALAWNGRDLVVGAPQNDRNGTSSGRVEVFHIEL